MQALGRNVLLVYKETKKEMQTKSGIIADLNDVSDIDKVKSTQNIYEVYSVGENVSTISVGDRVVVQAGKLPLVYDDLNDVLLLHVIDVQIICKYGKG